MVARINTKKIGLLGGSFNPAHNGHVGISLSALKYLDIDTVWWLVTPQNPLKQADTYAPLSDRLAHAIHLSQGHNIVVKNIETDLQSTYTIDVITHLQHTHTHSQFIWLMGADNVACFHLWHRWQHIAQHIPIAVFARPNTHFDTLQNSPFYAMLHQVDPQDIWQHTPNIWTYIHSTQYTQSATDIRNNTQQNIYTEDIHT